MDLETFMELARTYARFGWAIQEQVDTLLNGEGNEDNLNRNAVDMIADWARELDDAGVEGAEDFLLNAVDFLADTE